MRLLHATSFSSGWLRNYRYNSVLYFAAATWEPSNNPEPKAAVSVRTFQQYYRIFDIIASHIMLQGDTYTD